MTLKALSKPRKDIVLERTHHPLHQPRFLLDSPQPLAPRVLVQRQLLASNKELLPSGHLLLVPLPLARLLPSDSRPWPSPLSAVQLRIVEAFLPLLDQVHQLSQLPGPIQLPLLDQFSGSLHLAVLVAGRNQDSQHSAPPTLPPQIQPSQGPAPLAQPQGPDLGRRLLSMLRITHPLPLGNLHPLQLQHSPKHLRQPLLRRRHRHSASLRQVLRHLVNRRRYLVILPPLPLSVNQALSSVQHQPNNQLLAKLCRQYHRVVSQVHRSLMQNPLPPISQTRSRRTGRVQIRTTLYYRQIIPHCCRTMCAQPSRPHDSLGITSLIGSHPWICDRLSYMYCTVQEDLDSLSTRYITPYRKAYCRQVHVQCTNIVR
jgi:hypothetical protein